MIRNNYYDDSIKANPICCAFKRKINLKFYKKNGELKGFKVINDIQ